MSFQHFDEAKSAAETAVKEWLRDMHRVTRAMLVRDLFGKFSLAVWSPVSPQTEAVRQRLHDTCGPWWKNEVLHVDQAEEITRDLYAESSSQARPDADEPRLVVLDRHRNGTAWFTEEAVPLWNAPDSGPPLVVFYSFKGGLGRSTILASFAIQRARAGERVCVVDLDLDSPGVGKLLAADEQGLTAPWGVVDFLLEQPVGDISLSDYFHRCDRVAGPGEILVFPAGRMASDYPDKLARVDMDEGAPGSASGLASLLERARDELKPQWILLDARTGISESAGRLLSGIAHIHVLMGTTQEQSWEGLKLVLDRLGKEHVVGGRPQAEVILVQAMVPAGPAGRVARGTFLAQAEQAFTDLYYADEDDEAIWSVRDLDSRDAPHRPIPVDYDANFASFGDIAAVADALCLGSFAEISERITARFASEADS